MDSEMPDADGGTVGSDDADMRQSAAGRAFFCGVGGGVGGGWPGGPVGGGGGGGGGGGAPWGGGGWGGGTAAANGKRSCRDASAAEGGVIYAGDFLQGQRTAGGGAG